LMATDLLGGSWGANVRRWSSTPRKSG